MGSQMEQSDGEVVWTECCIFKIPSILRRHNESAFVPNAFSFGPLFHWLHFEHLPEPEKLQMQSKYEHLKDTYRIKRLYLENLMLRSPTKDPKLIDSFHQQVMKLETKARNCYAMAVHLNPDNFVKILLLDACFIIEVLRREGGVVPFLAGVDPIFDVGCMQQNLRHDLLLLENQIPWLVLECLFDMTKWNWTPNSKTLTQLVIQFFGHNFFSTSRLPVIPNNHGCKHILDLLRHAIVIWTGDDKQDLEGRGQVIPCVTDLVEAGIKFKKVEDSNSILNIKFKNGVIEMPSLIIMETTDDAFRNLISFEQCYPKCTGKITSYAILLDNLINTTKDMDLLRENGVVDCWLTHEEAFQFFNLLYRDTFVQEFYYNKLCDEVNDYCKRKWPRWRAAYVRNHFSTPWAIVSQIVGVIVVILTVLQTIYTITPSSS